MSRFLSERFAGLEAYTPGEQPKDQQYIKLNTNESPYPPSPEVFQRVSAAEVEKLNLYPDPEGKILKEKLAGLYDVEAKNIFLSNGSDDIINFAFMAFCDANHGVMYPSISYGFYPVYSDLYRVPTVTVPLNADFSINHKDYCGVDKMVVIANPNAPTGMEISLEQIREILASNPNQLVLIDEAYVDFGGTSAVELVKEYDNLLVSMTFSKSRSLAGARLGFAIASEGIIEDLEKIKFSTNPYNINRLTLVAGEASVDSDAYYKENAKKIIATRERTVAELTKMDFTVLDSKANFIFVTHKSVGGNVFYTKLKEKGLLVRYFNKPLIDQYMRVTIGTDVQMDAFLEKVAEIIVEEDGAK
ncbi:histidinol-phosphate transaminase [Chakrabartyella piscis]|uniref:histidinol-phosphate transaminase n=1 Tax=Chakrabartyella piscis TaxID=2918914 RepID=UPI002958C8E7|nr:histidinol-phosphate transaminase [Chakrabartyella piscis]